MHRARKVYVADTLAEKYGHKVLRLVPYDDTLNTIENILEIAKKYYSNNKEIWGNSKNCFAVMARCIERRNTRNVEQLHPSSCKYYRVLIAKRG